ncbi:hypothetical protein MKY84_00715 [Chryseomicrobium sp. FSL W7-1435]|uniref:hypothetical protein n=1 Tax=Chryseomicrobium sp. FSL W7-1435 TaxID=2921704 RepID=UPI00315B21D6
MSSMTTIGFGIFSILYLVFILAIIGFVIWFMVQIIQTQRAKVRVLQEISSKMDSKSSNRDAF